MRRAVRWLKGLFGIKKEKDHNQSEKLNSEKKRWSFAKSGRGSSEAAQTAVTLAVKDTDWLRSYIADSEKEQNKHAIAVAAATAAAADAAVAAAQAAVAVVRLTSQGRGAHMFSDRRERMAATKIQTVFRGYLARKALRALKGLVKLQAVVRGYLVRKRATATLHSMQALIRAQSVIQSQRVRRSFNKENNRFLPETQSRKSIEKFEETINDQFHSRRLSDSKSYENPINLEEIPKIVEIDTCKPRTRSRRFTMSEWSEDMYYHAISSPLPYPVPTRVHAVDCRPNQEFEWCLMGEECKFPTTQSTPRFGNSMKPSGAATPAKSVCGDSFFGTYNSNFPNYMANTQSFKAKLRSQSAPKQRPETWTRRKLSLNEIMAARSSLSGVGMQRSFLPPQEEAFDF